MLSMFNLAKMVVLAVFFSSLLSSGVLSTEHDVSPEEIIDHIKYLSSDELNGREAGSAGAEKAARYISDEFKKLNLKPFGDKDSYYQEFTFKSGSEFGEDNLFQIISAQDQIELELESEYLPLDYSNNAIGNGSMVFVGYGISAPELDHDDYKDVDVQGKYVLAMRYTPDWNDKGNKFNNYAPFRKKIRMAKEKGAKGIIFFTPPGFDEEIDFKKLQMGRGIKNRGVQVFIVRRNIAMKLLNVSLEKLEQLKNDPESYEVPNVKLNLRTDLKPIKKTTSNVAGIIEGSDPVLKNEIIVIGAHYDHIGSDFAYSRSDSNNESDQIHNGADDNASGVAGLLELAEYFSDRMGSLKRSILFIAFSGEELGLLGSNYFVEHSKNTNEKIVAMINMDMIGRMSNNKLIILGADTSPQWKEIIDRSNSNTDLKVKLNETAFAPSDQLAFYLKDIPVLQFFTGLHEDYHTTNDHWEYINQDGQVEILKLVSNIVLELDCRDKRIAFNKLDDSQRTIRGFKVYLGTIPDYTSEENGVSLVGVRNGSPADAAGMISRDIIISFDGKEINDIYDYVDALNEVDAGKTTKITVLRESKKINLDIIPEMRNKQNSQ